MRQTDREKAKRSKERHSFPPGNSSAFLMAIAIALLLSVFAPEVKAFSIDGGSYHSLSTYSGIKKFNYAAKPVRENFLSSDMVDSDYSFKTASKAVDQYFGTRSNYKDKTGITRTGFYLNKNTKGKCGVRYNRLFQYNNCWVDVKTTYTNWSVKNKAKAFAAGGFCSIWWTNVKWVKLKHEFFVSGTDTPIWVNGFFTYTDVDDAQGIGMPIEQVKKLWVNSKGTILKYKKEDELLLIKSNDVLIPNKSHSGYNVDKAATAMFSYQFSGKNHTQYILDGNADGSENIIGFDAAKYIPSVIPQSQPPGIEKYISDKDENNVHGNTVSGTDDTWSYTLNGLVPLETEPGNFYSGFAFTDTVDNCLEIRGVRILKNGQEDVSEQFVIQKNGEMVKATARNCTSASFYGCNYQLQITAGVKNTMTESGLKGHGHYDSSRDALVFHNTGQIVYQAGGSETTRNTNTVTTEIPLPHLDVKKNTSKKEYQVGEWIDYTVKIVQTKPKAEALNLSVCDDTLPPEVQLKKETLKISGVSDWQIKPLENGYLVQGVRLGYGQTAVISYKARAVKAAANKNICNTAAVTAMFVKEEKAQATVHIKPYDVSGKKIWQDKEDQDGLRPEAVTIRLLANGENVAEKVTSEALNWKYTFENLERYDQDDREICYTLEEEPVPGYTSHISGFNIMNTHPPEQITIRGQKTWNDVENLDKIRPKRVIVYLLADGEKRASKTISEENNWNYSWTVDKYRHRGIRIDYTVKEKAVEGYKTETAGFDLLNTHVPYEIRLVKYEQLENGEKTETPLEGAEYLVYRKGDQEENGSVIPDEYLGRYRTDANGHISVKGLSPGAYYLVEAAAPKGYIKKNEPIPVQVEKAAEQKNLKAAAVTLVTDYNQRKYGSLQIVKKDDSGTGVAEAGFILYKDENLGEEQIAGTTDEKGSLRIDKLCRGSYFLKEAFAPKGYIQSGEIKKIVIEPENLNPIIQVTNRQKKGHVILTKTDESETLHLKGAVYNLYDDAGKLAQENLVTDENGRIEVKGLSWGGYYFQEQKAPEGYGVSDEKIRFSVNSTTGGMTQHVEAIDRAKQGKLTISKQLRAGDIHYAHGTPSFVFRAAGTTVDGEKKSYYQMITFPEDYVKEHTDEQGNVINSVVFADLKAGTYEVEEMNHIRYQLKGVEHLSANGQKTGEKAVFDLTEKPDGEATFINDKKQWQNDSDTAAKMNLVKLSRKLTGLAVHYQGGKVLEGNSLFPKEDIEVTAVYDDGTEKLLQQGQYELKNYDGSPVKRVPKAAGTYTIIVAYEDNGICRNETLSYEVEAVKLLTIHFDTNGGEDLAPLVAEKYSCLADYNKSVYTPQRPGFVFTGWYEDQNLKKRFDEKQELDRDKVLYAGWEEKHLEDYSWEEIKAIADSGEAETTFDECFSAVKKDLEDGELSSETLKHMKAFELRGQTYHAMILGFNQDVKEDGSKAGISFMVKESLMTSVFNPTLTNKGGWKLAQLRTELDRASGSLPADMKKVIAPVKKQTGLYENPGMSEITWDRLWLLSQSEVCGAWGYEGAELEHSIYFGDDDWGNLRSGKGEGVPYKLFKDLVPDGKVDEETALTFGRPWWLRSVNLEGDQYFCFINEKGAAR